jgi:hypothetical protein
MMTPLTVMMINTENRTIRMMTMMIMMDEKQSGHETEDKDDDDQYEGTFSNGHLRHTATEIKARGLDCFRSGLTDEMKNFLDLEAPPSITQKESKSLTAQEGSELCHRFAQDFTGQGSLLVKWNKRFVSM